MWLRAPADVRFIANSGHVAFTKSKPASGAFKTARRHDTTTNVRGAYEHPSARLATTSLTRGGFFMSALGHQQTYRTGVLRYSE